MMQIKLGVWFDQELSSGGGYQQSLNAAFLINKISNEILHPVYFTPYPENISELNALGFEAHLIAMPFLFTVFLKFQLIFKRLGNFRLFKCFFNSNLFERKFLNHGIDLVYFLSPSPLAVYLNKINFVTTVWDLAHRDDVEFPEVRCDGVFEGREDNYRKILPKAIAVIADSPLGRDNLIHRYGIDFDRIHIISFSAGEVSKISNFKDPLFDVKSHYQLSIPYVFYPAQFWAHKNHIYILEGIMSLENIYGIKVGAIFSGVDKGNMNFIRYKVDEFKLSDRVKFAGFVPSERLYHLYKQSLALVMPTYFGPTNLPPLEAFSLGVPVLYSDKGGLREQVGDAAFLMNLQDPDSMAKSLNELIINPSLSESMKKNGLKLISDFNDDDRVRVLEVLFLNFQRRCACWA